MAYEDVEWEKLFREDLLRKKRVSVLNLYIAHHNLTTEKKLTKTSKLDLVSAHIQVSAALGTVSTINDTSDPKSSVTSSAPSDDSQTSEDCVLQEVGSDSTDEDDIPLAKLASINSSSDSDSNVPLSKLRNT